MGPLRFSETDESFYAAFREALISAGATETDIDGFIVDGYAGRFGHAAGIP